MESLPDSFLAPSAESSAAGGLRETPRARLQSAGKFFNDSGNRVHLRGVTYGPFNPELGGTCYRTPEIVNRDFLQMSAHSINAVRLYSPPPIWLLDIAETNNLRIFIGAAWTQHVAFFDHPELKNESDRLVDQILQECGQHPAVAGIIIGNEIPARIVRWYGPRRIEKHLEQLFNRVKQHGPDMLVTYANFPSTEYLQLPFLDFLSFNIYLNEPERLQAYLARLHHLAGDRPLVISEIGVDSATHGEPQQAATLVRQIETVIASDAAGVFVFSWTDEWFHHGCDIHDWQFGLLDRDRKSRIALDGLRSVYEHAPVLLESWPRVSVVICSCNGAKTIRQTIEHCLKLDYPGYNIIVVDDGSTDATRNIAAGYKVQLIEQKHLGLSAARNAGIAAADGEVVAFIDDDAYPDPDWLTILLSAIIEQDGIVGAGGPNLPVPGDSTTAECVAHTPGGPTHILLTDTIAEHIPGCNMAFYRDALLRIGGFDPRFQIAGDDVDLCWRLQQAGGVLVFAPGAQVWHHRRGTLKAFWRQQVNYGKAEAMLARKWPQKYNATGQLNWSGRMYPAQRVGIFNRGRIYHGVWCEAPFQSRYQVVPGIVVSLPLMPQWYLFILVLGCVSLLGVFWSPFRLAIPVGILVVSLGWLQAIIHARHAIIRTKSRTSLQRVRMRLQIALLFRLQPLARCVGRYGGALRFNRPVEFVFPWPVTMRVKASHGKRPVEWLQLAEQALQARGVPGLRGGDYDSWDLQINGNWLTAARVNVLTEELGNAKQVVIWRVRPRCSLVWAVVVGVAFAVAIPAPGLIRYGCITAALVIAGTTVLACGSVMAAVRRVGIIQPAADSMSMQNQVGDDRQMR